MPQATLRIWASVLIYLVGLTELYDKLMNLLLKFANHGVIHGDYNEFNIMIGIQDDILEKKDFASPFSFPPPRIFVFFSSKIHTCFLFKMYQKIVDHLVFVKTTNVSRLSSTSLRWCRQLMWMHSFISTEMSLASESSLKDGRDCDK